MLHRLVTFRLKYLSFFGSTAYISDIFQYILCFHFSNVLWVNKNWNACSNACDLAAWDRASSWLALIEVSRRWLPPWTSTFCWNRTNTKLEMKSTMHFNHYLLIRYSKNEKNIIYQKSLEINSVWRKPEKTKIVWNHSVKEMFQSSR